jgi:transcriptional regulator with XRE-family HTH domain
MWHVGAVHGWELRERRRGAGLTLRAVARAAGTSVTNVSAYERGTKAPNARTLSRLVAVIVAGSASPVHTQNLLTVAATAAALRRGLREGWETADLLRLVREMVSNSKLLKSDADRAAFFVAPSTTGDQRWDVMLAGVTEHLALQDGREPPAWTQGPRLAGAWYVGSMPSLRTYTLARSPFSLQIRGVMLDPADLESA